MYSIKAITALTGLSAETLRAWERRYDGLLPARTETGRRQYSQLELEKLSLLASLTRNGHPISKIVGLECGALRQLQSQGSSPSISEQLLSQILDALMAYKIDHCEQLLKRGLLAFEPLDYAREILLPALKKIGDLWHEGRLSAAQEHLFSNCIKRIVMGMVSHLQSQSQQEPAMLFATPSGEPHEFGILLSCLLAAAQSYRCYFLGADLPGRDIIEAVNGLQADILVIGMTKTPPESGTLQELQVIARGNFKKPVNLWLGGSGAFYQYHQQPDFLPHGELLENIEHFHRKAQQWRLV